MEVDRNSSSFLDEIDALLSMQVDADSGRGSLLDTGATDTEQSLGSLDKALEDLSDLETLDKARSGSGAPQSAEAYLNLAVSEISKKPGTRDIQMIMENLRTAAEMGNGEAANRLGVFYQLGLEENDSVVDKSEAAKYYEIAARLGNVNAKYNYAIACKNGMGRQKNLDEAARWMREAAEQGLPSAQNSYGVMYRDAAGVAGDHEEAEKWFRRASQNGVAEAFYNLGMLHAQNKVADADIEEAIRCFEKAYEMGVEKAARQLGAIFKHRAEFENACLWYSRLSSLDYPEEAAELAYLYYCGYGPNHHSDDGLVHALPLAKTQPTAAMVIASCFFHGQGLDKDFGKALEHAQFATQSKNVNAKANAYKLIASIYQQGLAGEQDEQKAFESFKSAAELGLASSKGQLAKLYLYGIGCERSLVEARRWAEASMSDGDDVGRYILAQVILDDCRSSDQDIEMLKRIRDELLERDPVKGYLVQHYMFKVGKGEKKSLLKSASAVDKAYKLAEEKYGPEQASRMIKIRKIGR